ncbi:putative zinc knuckle domain-containing protein [Organic Lake phycodnavirus 1]|jgi:hypothetical protein|nr:putative zinc knuckle domain-containing protein [Organic Lake phycodnavirus 1]
MNNNKICYYCRKVGHTVFQCDKVPPCRLCGKKGHKEERCRNVFKASVPNVPAMVKKETPALVLLDIDWDEPIDRPVKMEKLDWADEKNW